MLGINESRMAVAPPFSKLMIESLKRANSGNLNHDEIKIAEREEMLSKSFSSIWV